jgi:hypothetical protein
VRRLPAAAVVLAALAACGGGGGDEGDDAVAAGGGASTTIEVDGSAACEAERHAVVFGLDGVLTPSDDELIRHIEDASYVPATRDGAAELVTAWQERGYEIVYISGRPTNMVLHDRPVLQVTEEWLASSSFPTGEGTTLHLWDPAVYESKDLYKLQTIFDLVTAGVVVEAAYTESPGDYRVLHTGGVDVENLFAIGTVEGAPPEASIDATSFRPHLEAVVTPMEPLGSRCGS